MCVCARRRLFPKCRIREVEWFIKQDATFVMGFDELSGFLKNVGHPKIHCCSSMSKVASYLLQCNVEQLC